MTGTLTAHPGSLWLVPAPLDFGCDVEVPLQDLMPLGTLQAAARLTHWVCENAKSTRAYLKRVNALVPLAQPLQSLVITELPRAVHKKGDHHGELDARPLLAAALQGHDIGLPPQAVSVLVLPSEPEALPFLFLHAPRPLAAWSTALARAPPSGA